MRVLYAVMVFYLTSCALVDQVLYPGGREAASKSTQSNQTQIITPSPDSSTQPRVVGKDGVEFVSIGGPAHLTIDKEYLGETPIRHKFDCGLFDESKQFLIEAAPVGKGCDYFTHIYCRKLPQKRVLIDMRCTERKDININLKQTIKKE